jgi:hypothetical protein
MIPKIIEVRNNEVIYNIDVLAIAPLRNLIDNYPKEEHMLMLKILYFYFPSEDNPYKAFMNIEEDERLDKIIEHFKAEKLQVKLNSDFVNAMDFLENVYITTAWKFYLGSKTNIEQLIVWAKTAVTDGLGSNASAKMSLSDKMLNMFTKHEELEEAVKKNLNKSRGNKKVAKDIDKSYE